MRIYLTAKDTEERFHNVAASKAAPGAAGVFVDGNAARQTILGFGGAFTEAAAYTFSRMSEAKRKQIIDLYYSPSGARYNLGRVAIASSDFSLEPYDYIKDGDVSLESFDMSREERYVLPMLKQAEASRGGPVELLASPWSPPAFMKDNNDRLHGGHLLSKYYADWARFLIKYIQTAVKLGFNVKWLSVQNETEAVQTWDSCIYTPEEERDFVRGHLGPALAAAGLADIGILVHDHNRDNLLPRVLPIYADGAAAKYIWGAAVHWYVSEDFAAVGKLHAAHPDKHILFTEGCQEGGTHIGAWHTGERYARNIIGDLNNYAEGWIDWNLILDEQGGPNHAGNFCDAPVICDTRSDEVYVNSSYYYITHFSRFIKPGAVRLESRTDNPALQTLAARNPDGGVTLVVTNASDGAQPFAVTLKDETAGYTLPPHSIVTIVAGD